MPKYELSIEPDHVAEAEQILHLDGRAFPTVAVQWESQMLGQTWTTTLVLDYTIPLPPLKAGHSFNEVRIAAYTADVPTKFLYFGTELTDAAPRVAPEMENIIGPARAYQEYRLQEATCALPYVDLIQSTPRVYGNGAQDYYSPPIQVERFDASPAEDLIADNFPAIVADLPPIPGEILTDPRGGFWQGARFVGTKKIAILRQGKVVGLHQRAGREREVVPPEVVRRDPKTDLRDAWVAIDIGRSTTAVAVGTNDQTNLVRIGTSEPARLSSDYEVPTEVWFGNLPRTIKAWRDRVNLPLTVWGDVCVGHGARSKREVQGRERANQYKTSVIGVADLFEAHEAAREAMICGRSDLETPVKLVPPAPPVIDEEGVHPDDPFDPMELFAYYVGLHVNQRQRGIHLKYALGMPTGWKKKRREQVIASFRRGIHRSLPAGMVAYDDLDMLQVVDAGPNVLSFAAFAFRVFGIQPRGEPVPFVSIEAGASETAIICGQYRDGTPDEAAAGFERVVEHVDPVVLSEMGGEKLLHRMAYKVYAASGTSMRHNDIPFEPPAGEEPIQGADERLVSSLDARANVEFVKDAVRSILESPKPQPLADLVHLFDRDGRIRDVRIMIDRAALSEWLRGQLSEAAVEIKEAIAKSFDQMARGEVPYDDMRVLLGGRVGMHPFLQERLQAVLPKGVRVHKFREPDHTNLSAPTVKLATAMGIITMRYQQMGPSQVSDDRVAFKYKVGRARHGKLFAVLDAAVGYDAWRELGACTRPEVTVLYAHAEDAESEISAEDPAVQRAVCTLGYDAVGYRIYMRAVGGARIEVAVGPPGGRPDEDAPCWAIDLNTGNAEPLSV